MRIFCGRVFERRGLCGKISGLSVEERLKHVIVLVRGYVNL